MTSSTHEQVHICSKDFREIIKSFKINGNKLLPRGVATNGEHIFISDHSTEHIMKYTMDGCFTCQSKELYQSNCGIAIYGKKLFVAQQSKGTIEVLDLNLKFLRCVVRGLKGPRDVAVASDETIYVSEVYSNCIKKFKNGKLEFEKEVNNPQGICVYKKENDEYIVVAAMHQSHIYVFSSSGTLVKYFDEKTIGKINKQYGICVDSDGNGYTTDFVGNLVKKFNLGI